MFACFSFHGVLRRIPSALCAFAVLVHATNIAHGELILDDFDDPATTVSPAMRNEFVDTLNVGDLSARRSIRIAAFSAEPEGRIDVDASGNSAFIATLGALNPTDTILSKIVAVQSNYDLSTPGMPLSGKDVSQAGWNNAIVFDFRELAAAIEIDFFNVLVQDLSDSYEIPLIIPSLSDDAFSIVVPFGSFQFRGGGVGAPDFSAIRSINMELRVLTGNGPEDLGFQMELDRIRFVRIPEPASKLVVFLGLAVSGCMCRASRRLSQRKELENGEALEVRAGCSGDRSTLNRCLTRRDGNGHAGRRSGSAISEKLMQNSPTATQMATAP